MRPRYVLPLGYMIFAALVWLDFARSPPDGLANLGLAVAVLPVTALGLAITSALGRTSFMLIPDGFGYHLAHAIFYVPSVLLVSTLLWAAGRAWERKLSGK